MKGTELFNAVESRAVELATAVGLDWYALDLAQKEKVRAEVLRQFTENGSRANGVVNLGFICLAIGFWIGVVVNHWWPQWL